MTNEAGESYPHTMESYLKEHDDDLPYRLLKIGNEDNGVDTINTEVSKEETKGVATDNSPVSETGTWEMVDHEDAK
ncbi:hypothetical protein Trco_002240 [Trichoderma cornu-damae]|uniref:Uncharacterized protein n=1 Tax=Trichoderma cornu-damae TaxID=654480 RepID=A0A9P8QPG2_9HYPO|nr:hypothetical protein Trco_002240 [Trichoderma cornu-damae]